jgi:adenosylcobinamide-GDP ribazoletransferase
MLARMAQVLLAATLPYARPGGGTATNFVEGAGTRHLFVALCSAALLLMPLVHFDLFPALVLMMGASLSAASMVLLSRRKIEGVTGDVLGASSEITETVVWLTAALLFRIPLFTGR